MTISTRTQPDFEAPEGSPEHGWVKVSAVLFQTLIEGRLQVAKIVSWGPQEEDGSFSPTVVTEDFLKAFGEGLADVEAGRITEWSEIEPKLGIKDPEST